MLKASAFNKASDYKAGCNFTKPDILMDMFCFFMRGKLVVLDLTAMLSYLEQDTRVEPDWVFL